MSNSLAQAGEATSRAAAAAAAAAWAAAWAVRVRALRGCWGFGLFGLRCVGGVGAG